MGKWFCLPNGSEVKASTTKTGMEDFPDISDDVGLYQTFTKLWFAVEDTCKARDLKEASVKITDNNPFPEFSAGTGLRTKKTFPVFESFRCSCIFP